MRIPSYLDTAQTLALSRPLRLFGKKTEVKLSTALTLMPATALWAATGMSIQQLIESAPGDVGPAFKSLTRVLNETNVASRTTENIIKQKLNLVGFAIEDSASLLQSFESLSGPSPWQLVAKWIGEKPGDDLYRVISRLAELEVLFRDAHNLSRTGATKEASTLLERQLGHPEIYWRELDVSDQVSIIIDVLLQAIANAERVSFQPGGGEIDTKESGVLKLLKKGKTPIGHWLLRMQQAACCSSLSKLSDLVCEFEQEGGAKFASKDKCRVSYERLRYWSSGRDLMTYKAAKYLLKAIGENVDTSKQLGQFCLARFLSFICDLCIAGTNGEAPSWAHAQEIVLNRYRALFERAVP